MAKKFKIILIIILVLLAGEIILQTAFGFCDNVLVQADENLEYIAQPNQDRYILGRTIFYNEQSMRSGKIVEDALIILGMGDSVINGGILTDQKDLATDILTEDLSADFQKKIQVLNIAYKSWGPDNVYAYLEKYGDFEADILFLVASSHDAYDNMTFENIVGNDKNYPQNQYKFAYFEIFDRYLIPKFQKLLDSNKTQTAVLGLGKNEFEFNTGFADILSLSLNRNIPFIIYLHPEISEINKRAYNDQGQMIIEFAKTNGIEILFGLQGAKKEQYQDNIHLNEAGQKHLAGILLPVLKEHLNNKKPIPAKKTKDFRGELNN